MDGDLSKNVLKTNQEGEKQTLYNIQQLQEMEKELYKQLEANAANNATAEQQGMIIKKINELSQLRISLFKTLSNVYKSLQSSVANSRVNLVDQLTAVGIVEGELNNAKTQLNELETIKNNKMRMVEINTYYGKRYKAHTQIIKKLILISVPLLILAILKKKGLIPSIIPEMFIYGISGLIILLGGYSILTNIIDVNSRDNMDFDEYSWSFNPDAVKPSVYEYDKAQLLGSTIQQDVMSEAQTLALGLGVGCVGANCCSDGMTYDEDNKKCIEKVDKESFMSGQFNKASFIGGSGDEYIMSQNQDVQPYSEGVNFASF
jgi:hypothetical protein